MNFKLICLIAIVACWIIGGQWKGRIRDVGVCVVLGLYFGIAHWSVWAFLTGGAANIIRLGYGNYDPEHDDKPSFLASITHDRNGWWIRAIWGLLVGIVLPIFLRLSIPKYIIYIVASVVVNFTVTRTRQNVWVTDTLVALTTGSILFLA